MECGILVLKHTPYQYFPNLWAEVINDSPNKIFSYMLANILVLNIGLKIFILHLANRVNFFLTHPVDFIVTLQQNGAEIQKRTSNFAIYMES